MKKTLVALAVLSAAAVSAQAASVTLYGAVDGGFKYEYSKKTGEAKTSAFKLDDGLAGSNKFGFKGEEDLGNGYAVGFKLENGFSLASGKLQGALFNREAQLYVKGAFGTVAAGRIGALGSSAGSYDMFFGNGDAFDGGDKVGTGFYLTKRYNNTLTYVTPDLGGFTGYAQYSFSQDKDQQAPANKNDRFYALGGTFAYDNFAVAALFQQEVPQTQDGQNHLDPKKPTSFGLGANVQLDAVKLFAAAQYAKHVKSVDNTLDENYTDGTNVAGTLGATYAAGANEVTAAGYLGQVKDKGVEGKPKTSYFSLNARYTYSLSDRTSVFVGADGSRAKVKGGDKTTKFVVYSGLHHSF